MKVLNLYAGIGGNRMLWTGCRVTSVERDPNIAAVYKSLAPDDTVIVADAHAYLSATTKILILSGQARRVRRTANTATTSAIGRKGTKLSSLTCSSTKR